MHYTELTDKIIEEGLRSGLGATPATSVNVELGMAIRGEGDGCPFQKVGRGLYIWKQKAGITGPPSASLGEVEEEEEVQYDVVSSFGMFWRREAISWVSTPKILGKQQIGAQPVDFHKQAGIYLLLRRARSDLRWARYRTAIGKASLRAHSRQAFHPMGSFFVVRTPSSF